MKSASYQPNSLVSICIPTYNRTNLISNLLDSILSQSYTNFEIIITDNSENTDTQLLIEHDYQDPRIRYFKNKQNLGMGGNTRRALSYIRGTYFTFTPDDDVWIDVKKLEKQVQILDMNPDINIVYTNAESIDYEGKILDPFDSIYHSEEGKRFERLCSSELLPGNQTKYFLNILTPLIRVDPLLDVFVQSWYFNSEEYFCFYLSATKQEIGFVYDKTVSLREAEHYRTAIEDGIVVDWGKRKDLRIRQIIAIYTTLTNLFPKTKERLETSQVQNFLARHLISAAKSTGSLSLILKTFAACSLIFRNSSFIGIIKIKKKKGKSFG